MIYRVPLFVLGFFCLPATLLAPPMVAGLCGVLISLEGSVGLGARRAYECLIFRVGGVLLIRGQHLQARAGIV
ncbi:hypothetical protein NOC27_96 [Nitrosococcus oceani AFC27]|uniref:Uncharacterized protein n=1 Tax=Nitrosococcus oceani C-27 TaxID=314279 RepID=A0A0E2Z3D5_9GAMM|nr:hypothetical protein [Nitrosococcus oceani]EDZ66769.1 hypothetical protein NOC27_96 [Nitrosococcus oceani AFC27]KFI19701.1 hypothetical protein IB75_07805 [Nitrosococcus oceani C-27]